MSHLFTALEREKDIRECEFKFKRGRQLFGRLLHSQGFTEEQAAAIPDAPPRERNDAEERECEEAAARLAEMTRKKREKKDQRWQQKQTKREAQREASKGKSHKPKPAVAMVVAKKGIVTVLAPVPERKERRVRVVELSFDHELPQDDGGLGHDERD